MQLDEDVTKLRDFLLRARTSGPVTAAGQTWRSRACLLTDFLTRQSSLTSAFSSKANPRRRVPCPRARRPCSRRCDSTKCMAPTCASPTTARQRNGSIRFAARSSSAIARSAWASLFVSASPTHPTIGPARCASASPPSTQPQTPEQACRSTLAPISPTDPATGQRYRLLTACDTLLLTPRFSQGLNEKTLVRETVVTYHVTEAGDLRYAIDGQDKGIFLSGINLVNGKDTKLWPLLDIYGNTTTIDFIDARKLLNYNNVQHPVVKVQPRPRPPEPNYVRRPKADDMWPLLDLYGQYDYVYQKQADYGQLKPRNVRPVQQVYSYAPIYSQPPPADKQYDEKLSNNRYERIFDPQPYYPQPPAQPHIYPPATSDYEAPWTLAAAVYIQMPDGSKMNNLNRAGYPQPQPRVHVVVPNIPQSRPIPFYQPQPRPQFAI